MVCNDPQQPAVSQITRTKSDVANVEGRKPSKESCLVPLHSTWQRSLSIGAGLVNYGNSCYLNSVLQCLTYLPPLASLCVDKYHSRACTLPPASCTFCKFERHVSHALTCSQSSFGPQALYRSLHLISKTLIPGRQEDAHELLRFLLEALERDQLRSEGKYDARQRVQKSSRSVVARTFGGLLRSQVLCSACGGASNTFEHFEDLSLELRGAASVTDALHAFVAPEHLSGANRYKCGACKVLVAARKQMLVFDEPNVLVLHLKRFDGILGAKVTRHVAFQEQLDLRPFSVASDTAGNGNAHESRYRLCGVLVHAGLSANAGHYYAYVRGPCGAWWCMNDESVSRSSVEAVQRQQAYLLFYVRASIKVPCRAPGQEPEAPHTPHAGNGNASGTVQPQPQPQATQLKPRPVIGPQLPPNWRAPARQESPEPSSTPSAAPGPAQVPPASRATANGRGHAQVASNGPTGTGAAGAERKASCVPVTWIGGGHITRVGAVPVTHVGGGRVTLVHRTVSSHAAAAATAVANGARVGGESGSGEGVPSMQCSVPNAPVAPAASAGVPHAPVDTARPLHEDIPAQHDEAVCQAQAEVLAPVRATSGPVATSAAVASDAQQAHSSGAPSGAVAMVVARGSKRTREGGTAEVAVRREAVDVLRGEWLRHVRVVVEQAKTAGCTLDEVLNDAALRQALQREVPGTVGKDQLQAWFGKLRNDLIHQWRE